jgi:hypothetical protein
MMTIKLQTISTSRHLGWYLKKLALIYFGIILLASCSDKGTKTNKEFESETTAAYKTQTALLEQNEKVLLCKINGEDWYFTEVRCRKILSTDYNPREKFVLNFKNADTEAGENLTLMYDAKTLNLEHVDGALQNPNDVEGARAFYGIKGFTEDELAQIKDIGMLTDISGETISGTASFTITKNSKGVFQNELDRDIVVTDLKFINIPFEDESDR